MAYKKWEVKSVDRIKAKELALECDIEPIVALISASRGVTTHCPALWELWVSTLSL